MAKLPCYVPEEHGVGIVHIGVGAFHRAHQAVMTDDALAQHGGDWRIAGISLRSKDIATALNEQNGLFTVLERGAKTTTARVIGAIDQVVAADTESALLILSDPKVRIVTLTVTEAGYGIDRESGLPDINHPVVKSDLDQPLQPTGVLGLLVASIDRRRKAGVPPFTLLCCDNLPSNGAFLRDGVAGFARMAYGDELADWIQNNVSFPSSMVDRITPASTEDTYREVARQIGCDDKAAIETEPFIQWIIEDDFPTGRPQWEAGGAQFVAEVTPFERMKLTMLNGCHSMLAYSGFLTGKPCVRDVMQDAHLAALVGRHFKVAASLLETLPGTDYSDYASALTDRFSNPSIAHQTFQIASDGTQKLPQRIFKPAVEALACGEDIRPFAFASAMWMRFCLQQHDDGSSYELRDPRASEIKHRLHSCGNNATVLGSVFHSLPDLIPQELAKSPQWQECIDDVLTTLLNDGCRAAVAREADEFCELGIAT